MQRTNNNGNVKMSRRHIGSSTTLNRKYVKRPKIKINVTSQTSKSVDQDNKRIQVSDGFDTSVVINKQPESVEKRAIQRIPQHSPKIQRFNDSSSGYSSTKWSRSRTSIQSQATTQRSPRIQRFSRPNINASNNSKPKSTAHVTVAKNQPAIIDAKKQTVIHPMMNTVDSRMGMRSMAVQQEKRMTAKELKEQAIRKAMASASSVQNNTTKRKRFKSSGKSLYNVNRFVLAFACAAVSVFAIAYFVNINMPDISLKVAAMQTGINATYPSYVPRGYAISSIVSENKKIVLTFRNSDTDKTYKLFEESSSWDSDSLLNNYVKETFGNSYQTIKEQGLTIFISGSNAAWVNGGNVYKIKDEGSVLTQKQIKTIATSL